MRRGDQVRMPSLHLSKKLSVIPHNAEDKLGPVQPAMANIQPPVHKTASLSSESDPAGPSASSSIHHIHPPAILAYPAVSSQYPRAASAPPMSSSARVCQVTRRTAAAHAYGPPLGPVGSVSVRQDDLVPRLVANIVGDVHLERCRLGY
jgi:hypothetical protein